MFSFVLEEMIYKNPNREKMRRKNEEKKNKNHEYTQLLMVNNHDSLFFKIFIFVFGKKIET
jgi:hypothetical protein